MLCYWLHGIAYLYDIIRIARDCIVFPRIAWYCVILHSQVPQLYCILPKYSRYCIVQLHWYYRSDPKWLLRNWCWTEWQSQNFAACLVSCIRKEILFFLPQNNQSKENRFISDFCLVSIYGNDGWASHCIYIYHQFTSTVCIFAFLL